MNMTQREHLSTMNMTLTIILTYKEEREHQAVNYDEYYDNNYTHLYAGCKVQWTWR